MIYGVDVSAYQPNFDFGAAARDGVDFAFVKSTEGTNWRSPNYSHQVRDAQAVGILVAAYHYVRGSDVAGQLDNIRRVVSTEVPVILDVEEGAGSIQSIRQLNKALNDAGYRTPFIYIPKWYWSGHMGSPSLAGLPPNWLSWYPDNVVRRKEAGIAKIPASVWNGFGGLPIAIVQFTSSLAVANYPNGSIDGNAYRGSRDELAALLGGEEDDMPHSRDDIKQMVKEALYEAKGTDGRNVLDGVIQTRSELRDRAREAVQSEMPGIAATVVAEVAKLLAGDREGLTATEIEAAVAKAIRENVVKVDIDVNGQPSA